MPEEATQQETKTVTPPEKRNPTGKGGFGDHPEHRSPGGWKKENSFSYWMNFFKNMSTAEFKRFEQEHTEDEMTVAQSLAYARIANARLDLAEFKEVADRTEGKAKQVIEQETNINIKSHEQVAEGLQQILEAETSEVTALPETASVDPTKPLDFN